MEQKVKEILNNYYNNYNEDERLIRDKAHKIEFITTIKYIEKYLKKDDRILEIGAGTGRYSIYYASKGYEVDSIELIESNIKKMKEKIDNNMKININQGNAMNLNMYKDNIFDITLCLGPLYHLYNDIDKDKAIKEAIRVTKPNGIIYFSYLTNDSVILSYGLRKGNLKRIVDIVDEHFKLKDIPEEIFSVNYIEEFKNRMKKFNIKFLHDVATDGIASNMAEYINKLDDEEYDIWLKYHFSVCERKDLIGLSNHMLYICKKEE